MSFSLYFIAYASIFAFRCLAGWCLEVLFRKFFSKSNPEHKWINPGFCTGPWLPLYGCGVVVLALLTDLGGKISTGNVVIDYVLLFLFMGLCMTALEYVAGIILLKGYNLRLWDYRSLWGNINGLICPLFTFFWCVLSGAYVLFIHPYVITIATWAVTHLIYCFPLGVFFGVFGVDLVHSLNLLGKLKAFAKENEVILRFEELKIQAAEYFQRTGLRRWSFRETRPDRVLAEHFSEMKNSFETQREQLQLRAEQQREHLKEQLKR